MRRSWSFLVCRGLLDDQTAPERRMAAVVRLNKYAGLEPGFTPETELAKRYITLQMAVPNACVPVAHPHGDRAWP